MTDFTFSSKTGELRRGGRARIFPFLPAKVLGELMRIGVRVSMAAVAREVGVSRNDVKSAVVALRRRLPAFGMTIDSNHKGVMLVIGDMPRWQPNIPPPATIEA